VAVNGRADRAGVEAVAGEIESRGGKAFAVMADVTDEAAVARMMEGTARRFGGIDILVNNAAVRPEKPLEAMSLADWRSVLAVILDGAFIAVQAALPYLKKSAAGTVLNIGGVSGHTGTKDRAHVVTAKAGLIGLTRALAHDLAEAGVTANCVVPGLIDTKRDPGAILPRHHNVQKTLSGRLGLPQEIAAAVRFLAGPDARYITGQTLHVNGGVYLG
jgi:3-oxoacyl-[acyl-carrier protein] reductase